MPSLTFSSKYIGFQDYQPDPEDLCSLCGGNFGKAAMIEGKDKIHICMECVDLLGVIKKERDDKKISEAAAVIQNVFDTYTEDVGNDELARFGERIVQKIILGMVPNVRFE